MEASFLKFIANVMDVDEAKVSMSLEYKSIPEWDSLMQLRLVGEIEEEYGIEIPFADISNIKTLSDFYKYVVK